MKAKSGNSVSFSNLERFCAGSLAGVFAQTCIYPMEVMKTRLALRNTGDMNKGIIRAAVQLYRREGLKSFYRGYVPSICSILPYAGTDLVIYESLKNFYFTRVQAGNHDQIALLVCGACSSTCGQLASYPLALIRTRLQARTLISQADPSKMTGQVSKIWSEDGFFGFFRGVSPNFVKVLPAVAVSWLVYEAVREQLMRL